MSASQCLAPSVSDLSSRSSVLGYLCKLVRDCFCCLEQKEKKKNPYTVSYGTLFTDVGSIPHQILNIIDSPLASTFKNSSLFSTQVYDCFLA